MIFARSRKALSFALVLSALSLANAPPAAAQSSDPPAEPPPAPPPPSPSPPAPPPSPSPPPVDPSSLTPRPIEPPASHRTRFIADPVADTSIIALSLTFTLLSTAILSTGEVRPQQISPSFKSSQLLGIDRGAISQSIDSNANRFSNFGLYATLAYVATDSFIDIFRVGPQGALIDAIMYVEAGMLTQSLTNIAKIAFRRPRPIAYIERSAYLNRGGDPSTYDNSDTDSSLSFFSGHASGVAALGSAATYIAFSRSPRSVRPWLTLAGAAALTGFVSYERVRAGEHFPTDVIGGAVAGTAVGSLVVYLHREDAVRQRPVWIGAVPTQTGGVISASGLF